MNDEVRPGEVKCAFCEKRFASEHEAFEHWMPDHPEEDEFKVVRLFELVMGNQHWSAKAVMN